ncbi:fibrobacter succinogenes major paralogous domain-containing protein [Terrimonas alba]|uniref:fibrobacter succinogenes major paralogous domain-containing protein n=1 Tax=Terrimonas alba TaxID=3349636 RepID=UPI0035F237CE
MKKLLLPLLATLVFTSCQKQISTEKESKEIASATANKKAKIMVCHSSKTIEISQNALAAHLAHGDIQGDCSVPTTTICDQTWMVKNLNVDHYRNGDPIPQVTSPTELGTTTTGAWCYYDFNPANGLIYGKLYNWYAVNDPRGLAPEGWHVPSREEWLILAGCLGGINVAGGEMKETGTVHWLAPNTGATNSSGFTALPGGIALPAFSSFAVINTSGHWWTSTNAEVTTEDIDAWAHNIDHIGAYIGDANQIKTCGMSVRCVKN